MFKNYFKIASRQLLKQNMYSAIKIGGFALSIATCVLIALYMKDELSYDKYYPDTDRIYRLVENRVTEKGTAFPAPLYKVLKAEFPEIEKSGRVMPDPLFPRAGINEVIAIVVGSPSAWWAMSKWLQDFTYRTNIGWWVFVLSGGIVIAIALLTVSFQSIKAALTSPVKSLRAE